MLWPDIQAISVLMECSLAISIRSSITVAAHVDVYFAVHGLFCVGRRPVHAQLGCLQNKDWYLDY